MRSSKPSSAFPLATQFFGVGAVVTGSSSDGHTLLGFEECILRHAAIILEIIPMRSARNY